MNLDLTGVGSVADFAKTVVETIRGYFPNEKDKAEVQLKIQELAQQEFSKMLETQKAIIVAELNQGDNYTKRARPTIIYAGLGMMVLTVLLKFGAWLGLTLAGRPLSQLPNINLPTEFWWAWSGVCGVYVFGRSAEKRGAANKIIKMITGNDGGAN